MLLLVVLAVGPPLAGLLIVLLMPLLRRYALARPNARSSHRVPTPAGRRHRRVVAACARPILLAAALAWHAGQRADCRDSLARGRRGDRPLPSSGRSTTYARYPRRTAARSPVRSRSRRCRCDGRQTDPPSVSRLGSSASLLVLAGVWFVNLVNFMDGLDWITVAEIVPVTAFAVLARSRPCPHRSRSRRRAAAARFLGSPCSTSRSRGFSSATSARCRSGCSSAGCCSHARCRRRGRGGDSAAALLPRGRDDHACASPRPPASKSGRRTAPISTSRRPTTASRPSR